MAYSRFYDSDWYIFWFAKECRSINHETVSICHVDDVSDYRYPTYSEVSKYLKDPVKNPLPIPIKEEDKDYVDSCLKRWQHNVRQKWGKKQKNKFDLS